jgi:xanthine/uracil/vitamin C permease (AzgA family)
VSDRPRPSRGVWIAWGLAFAGGLAVLVGVGLALTHPCLQEGAALAGESCDGAVTPMLVSTLAAAGTIVAVVGGLTATVLTLRRPRPEPLR